jgi:glucose/arabinose dehydrogenase
LLTAALLATSVLAVEAHRPPLAAAATPPTGFSDALVGSFSRPTTVEWLPGDLIAVLEQGGRLKVGHPGGSFTTALTLDVCSNSERGLLGLAPDPAFLGNGLVYVYYTAAKGGGCVNRVSRFQMNGMTIDPSTEWILIDDISSRGGNHNGGDLDVGSDGYLYVGVGDAGTDPRGDSGSAGSNDAAQDLSLLNGKILRITLDGQPAPGNPFTGPGTARCAFRGNTAATPTTTCQEIFAYGLRNPYRFAFDRNDGAGTFFINDVGQNTYEEVNGGGLGLNYGWPSREGPCPQGATAPCPGPPAGLVDPIAAYGRSLGSYVTAGAFVPDGLWPKDYDGAYLFADGGSGQIWMRRANGAIDYGAPFATGAFGITDMTFGFDTAGRTVLYYVQVGGSLRAITPTTPPASAAVAGLRLIPVTPFRAYDTDGTGTPPGVAFNGTTRLIDLDPPGAYEAALVNLTYAGVSGPGFVRAWNTRGLRAETSSVNVDGRGSQAANAAIVPLDADGTFLLESTTTGRVIVDVMGWLDATGGTSDDGRFVAGDPARLVDSRIPAGTTLDSGSPNPWSSTPTGLRIDVAGELAVPDDGTAAAVVVSIGALSDGSPAGFVGAHPSGVAYSGTSNVNVLRGETRANMVVVPIGADGAIELFMVNVADVVVDVLGYVTSGSAATSGSGLYTSVDTYRLADSRIPQGFGTLAPLTPAAITVPGGAAYSAVVQNVTVTNTTGPGFVSIHPTPTLPTVSTLNYTGPAQTRAAFAFSALDPAGAERFTSFATADLIVDVVGFFSE